MTKDEEKTVSFSFLKEENKPIFAKDREGKLTGMLVKEKPVRFLESVGSTEHTVMMIP